MKSIINTTLPEFKVQAFHRGEFRSVSSEDLKGRWSILFFYPADFSFVCPTELVEIEERYPTFQNMGVDIYSVSCDTHFVHKAWADASEEIAKITYPMLSDPTGALARALGVMVEEDGMACRATFVIDPEGRIKVVEMQDYAIARNAEELMRKVEAAQFAAE